MARDLRRWRPEGIAGPPIASFMQKHWAPASTFAELLSARSVSRDVAKHFLYSKHTWGAWCSVSDSENTFTKQQWNFKRAFAVDAEEQSEALLAKALAAREANVASAAVEVYNCTSWPRTEVVVVPKETLD